MAVSNGLGSLTPIMTAAAVALGGGCWVGGLGDELVEDRGDAAARDYSGTTVSHHDMIDSEPRGGPAIRLIAAGPARAVRSAW